MNLPFFRKPDKHPKGWGHELWLASNEHYCGKLLCFNKGALLSSHYHAEKIESFYLLKGRIKFIYIDTSNANELWSIMEEGDVVDIPRFAPHQVEALEDSVIIEVSSRDLPTDSYRVKKGDSQTISPSVWSKP